MSDQKIITSVKFGKTIDTYNVNKFFEDYVLQKEYYPYQLDTWKDKKFYGLINNKEQAIYPKNEYLSLNSNDNGVSFQNMVFVSEAFQDMKKYHKSYLLNNKFNNNGSVYISLDIKASAEDLLTIHVAHLDNLYNIFSNTFLTNTRKINIKDFITFSKQFLSFIKLISPYFPITRSSFIKHKSCSPAVSGLTIDLATDVLYSDTATKADRFISDSNFDIFIDSARRFGFYVDKNTPWRLVADLASPVMKDYCKRYNLLSVDQVFQKAYHTAYYSDLEVIKSILIGFWNTYANSAVYSASQKELQGCNNLFAEINTYNQLDTQTFDVAYGKNWLIRFYLFTKVHENELKITQNIFEILYQEAIKLNEYSGESVMLDYVDRKMYELSTRGKRQRNQLTTADEMVKMLSLQEQPSIAEGINF
jgi:hypothetical protein